MRKFHNECLIKIDTSKFMELQSELAENVLNNIKHQIESFVHATYVIHVVDGEETSYTPQAQEIYNRVYDQIEEIFETNGIVRSD